MATKVFVGNLSFKIGSEQLREEFSAAGNVLSANIITRGPRSLGYGFVEFASLEEADKAVDLLNHKDIDGREINVEVAKPRTEPLPSERHHDHDDDDQRPPRRTRRPKAPRDVGGGSAPSGDRQAPTGAPRTRSQGGQQPQRQQQQEGGAPRRQYRPRFQNNQDNSGNAEGQVFTNTGRNFNNNNNNSNNSNNNNSDNNNARPFRPRNFRNRGPRNQGGQQQQQQQQQQQPQQQQQQPQFQRKSRPAPQPKKQQERVPSSTTLFVANLPFSVDDKELAEIFSKNLKVASAHVVKKRNTRSKGFGFVEFENEADQQAALKEFDGATVHERVLNVKVALTAVPGEEGADDEKSAAVEGEVVKHAEEKKDDAPKAEPAKESKADAAVPAAAAEGEEKKSGQ